MNNRFFEKPIINSPYEYPMGMTRIMALNDEAHHCYREKPNHVEEKVTGARMLKRRKTLWKSIGSPA